MLGHMVVKCAEVLVPSRVCLCAIAPDRVCVGVPGGVPVRRRSGSVCGSVPGVAVPALSQAFTGEPAPRQVLALPILPQTGVLSKRLGRLDLDGRGN